MQREAWTQDTEMLARIVELLNLIAARLSAGVPVQLSKLATMPKPYEVDRPPWLKTQKQENVMRPRDFFAAMRNQKKD